MPTKESLSDATLYFVDTETGERSILSGISEIDTVSEAQNLIAEEEKESSGRFKWDDSETSVFSINNFSIRDAYLRLLEAGVDVFWVPNNFRRTHGYKVRRRSLRKRRAMQKLKMAWKR